MRSVSPGRTGTVNLKSFSSSAAIVAVVLANLRIRSISAPLPRKEVVERLRADLQRAREEVFLDSLTRVLNRKGLDEALERGVSNVRRKDTPLSVSVRSTVPSGAVSTVSVRFSPI